jgi:hypothetical protein
MITSCSTFEILDDAMKKYAMTFKYALVFAVGLLSLFSAERLAAQKMPPTLVDGRIGAGEHAAVLDTESPPGRHVPDPPAGRGCHDNRAVGAAAITTTHRR